MTIRTRLLIQANNYAKLAAQYLIDKDLEMAWVCLQRSIALREFRRHAGRIK